MVDWLVGYEPNTRVDLLVKAQVLEEAAELSYQESGESRER